MNIRWKSLLAVPAVVALLAAPAAHADWRGRGHGWHGGPGWNHGWRPPPPRYYGPGPGAVAAGALLGLGVGALVGATLAPPVYYAPPPVYYAPPPPVYYAPAPVLVAPAYRAW